MALIASRSIWLIDVSNLTFALCASPPDVVVSTPAIGAELPTN
jgi:hypothetical protein